MYSQEEVNLMLLKYANLARQPLVDLTSSVRTTSSFQKYTRENIIDYLRNPQRNEKKIRDISIYMFNNSAHYHRLISYYALMPLWSYVILPSENTGEIKNIDSYRKQYIKTAKTVDTMNIRHEMQKVSEVVFREDVFYGITWESKNGFFIQKIDPDICELSSIEDGIYNFTIDFSKLKENELFMYPPIVTELFNESKRDGQSKKEIPTEVSACFKLNEDIPYPIPIFSGCLVSLYDIDDYKSLVKQRTEIGNYKALSMQIPIDNDGTPKLESEEALNYYYMMLDALPEYIGGFISPMKVESFNFEKNGGLTETDEISQSEEQFWSSSGTSPLLFGSGNKSSVSSLKLSIKSDEEIVIGFMRQVERWLNRKLKLTSGTSKFKVNILPLTLFNQEEMTKLYKESATYGLPTKSMYAASLGLSPLDIANMPFLENDILDLTSKFIPLASTHTQSTEAGRPTNEDVGKDLTESGEQTLEDAENEARG